MPISFCSVAFSQTPSSVDARCRPLCDLEVSRSIEDHDYIGKDVVSQLQEIRRPIYHLIIRSGDDDADFIELSYGLCFGGDDLEVKPERERRDGD